MMKSNDNKLPAFRRPKTPLTAVEKLKIPDNIIVRHNVSVDIHFRCKGIVIRDRIKMKPTQATLYDIKTRIEYLKDMIRSGSFNVDKYLEVFGSTSSKGIRVLEGLTGSIGEKITLEYWCNKYIEDRSLGRTTSTMKSLRTLSTYTLTFFSESCSITDIDYKTVKNFRLALVTPKDDVVPGCTTCGFGVSVKQGQLAFNLLREVLNLACQSNYLQSNPTDRFPKMSVDFHTIRQNDLDSSSKNKPVPYTVAEIKAISKVDHWFTNFMLFGIFSGLSSQEIRGLAVEDISDDLETMNIDRAASRTKEIVTGDFLKSTKNRSRNRVNPIYPGHCRKFLEKQLGLVKGIEAKDFAVLQRDNVSVTTERLTMLFCDLSTRQNNVLHASMVDRLNKAVLKLAGVQYRPPNQLKHTFTTIVLNKDDSLKKSVQYNHGHSDTKMIDENYFTEDRTRIDSIAIASCFDDVLDGQNV